MGRTLRRVALVLAYGVVLGFVLYLAVRGHSFPVLHPAGVIAQRERQLIIFATVLSLFVVVPVFALAIFIATRYRAENKRARYTPEWDHHRGFETVWWGIPILLICILSVVTWRSTHELDPYKALAATKEEPLKVQVVALNWKWLFIYPNEHVASVNALYLPAHRPVVFEITSDGPMNSFWIPQLAGQIYAMSGMKTQLHVQADETGTFIGTTANISGDGFADMKFDTTVISSSDYAKWIVSTQNGAGSLNADEMKTLQKPSTNDKPHQYAATTDDLFEQFVAAHMSQTAKEHN